MFQENIYTILFHKRYQRNHYPEDQNQVSHPKKWRRFPSVLYTDS